MDYQGIARALSQDLLQRSAAQGGSTITQQFVKNALSAQGDRSVFQKLREAALAYHLERKWSKDKILTQYLNTVYFGNGAYGVESAVRAYFRAPVLQPDGTTGYSNSDQAADVTPAEAALLAGHDRVALALRPGGEPAPRHRAPQPRALADAREQTISRSQYDEAVGHPGPGRGEHQPAGAGLDRAVLLQLATQQLVDRYGPGVVFGGGLKIKTTIDTDLQRAAEQAIAGQARRIRAERLARGDQEQHR